MICLICGFISMIVTVLFYILAFDNIFTIPMRWLSLLFLLIIEVLSMVKALKSPKTIMGTITILVSVIHLGIVFVLFLVFVNIFSLFIKKYVLINLLLITIVATIDVLLIFFSSRAKENNVRYNTASSVIEECLVKASILLANETTESYKKDLEDIVEMLKYSNRTEMCGCEMDILSGLDETFILINEGAFDEVSDKLNAIKRLIKIRSIQTKKRGNF